MKKLPNNINPSHIQYQLLNHGWHVFFCFYRELSCMGITIEIQYNTILLYD